MRRAARRDLAEPPIIDALERVGAEVWPLSYPVDVLTRYRNPCPHCVARRPKLWHLLEVKTGKGKKLTVTQDKRQRAQQNFIATTGTPICRTPIEALKAIGAV